MARNHKQIKPTNMQTTTTKRKRKVLSHDLKARAAAKIHIGSGAGTYGFGRTWELEAFGRRFYLGQDAKVCDRIIGLAPSDVVDVIRGNNISEDKINNNLAVLIIDSIGLTFEAAQDLEAWALACD